MSEVQTSDQALVASVPPPPPALGKPDANSGTAQRPSRRQPGDAIRKSAARGVVRIVCLFLLATALAVALDGAINRGLRSIKTSKFGSLNRIINGQVNADIIVSGSSRALSHYDPRLIEKLTGLTAYNIGMNASQIDFECAILKAYLKHNAKPQLVIQNLDLFSFETTKPGQVYDPGSTYPI